MGAIVGDAVPVGDHEVIAVELCEIAAEELELDEESFAGDEGEDAESAPVVTVTVAAGVLVLPHPARSTKPRIETVA